MSQFVYLEAIANILAATYNVKMTAKKLAMSAIIICTCYIN